MRMLVISFMILGFGSLSYGVMDEVCTSDADNCGLDEQGLMKFALNTATFPFKADTGCNDNQVGLTTYIKSYRIRRSSTDYTNYTYIVATSPVPGYVEPRNSTIVSIKHYGLGAGKLNFSTGYAYMRSACAPAPPPPPGP